MKWWLSFADPERPEGQQFLGVAVVEAPEFLMATLMARMHGCNPGGEVQGYEVPDDYSGPPLPMNQLLSKADLEALGHKLRTVAELEAEDEAMRS